jgi:hypothetical protein
VGAGAIFATLVVKISILVAHLTQPLIIKKGS